MFAFINISTFSSKEYCLLRKQTTPTDRKGPFISIAIPSHTCTPMMKMMISMMIWWSGSYWWSESWWYPTTGQTLGVCAPAGHPKAAWARQVPPHPSDLPPGPQPYGENAFNFNISYFQTRFYIFCPRVISSQRPCTLGRVEKSINDFSDSNSDMFSWEELDPKFWIWAFSAIFALSFWVANILIYIDNAFNMAHLKFTRNKLFLAIVQKWFSYKVQTVVDQQIRPDLPAVLFRISIFVMEGPASGNTIKAMLVVFEALFFAKNENIEYLGFFWDPTLSYSNVYQSL